MTPAQFQKTLETLLLFPLSDNHYVGTNGGDKGKIILINKKAVQIICKNGVCLSNITELAWWEPNIQLIKVHSIENGVQLENCLPLEEVAIVSAPA